MTTISETTARLTASDGSVTLLNDCRANLVRKFCSGGLGCGLPYARRFAAKLA